MITKPLFGAAKGLTASSRAYLEHEGVKGNDRLLSRQFPVRRRGRGQKPSRVTGVVALLAAVLAALVIVAGCGTDGDPPAGASHRTGGLTAPSSARRLPVIALTVPPGSRPSPIPPSFLGLSTEYWTLYLDERHAALYRRVISLLHVRGDGPLVLRVGGDSSDHALYEPPRLGKAHWAFALTPGFASRTAGMVRALHLHVIFDLNLLTASPTSAAAWVTETQKVFPRGSIIGYEIGNEPDLYGHAYWVRSTEPGSFAPLLPGAATPTSYAAAYDAFAGVIRRVDPRAALLGPAVSNPTSAIGWIRTLLARSHPGLSEITAHRYPYSGCSLPESSRRPTIAGILGEQASAGMAQSVRPMVALARHAGLPARLTEFNSVTCGGLRGVSNTFATALWAPDAIFELIRAGLSAANLHVRVRAINAPFTFDARGLLARPVLYGLILFTRTLGPHAQLMPLQLHCPPSLRLKAWAVRVAGNHLHVLLIDKGPRAAVLSLDVPATKPAQVQHLLAPSVRSRAGVTLAGQTLGQNGRWSGPRDVEQVASHADRYSVTLSPYSAALFSVAEQSPHGS